MRRHEPAANGSRTACPWCGKVIGLLDALDNAGSANVLNLAIDRLSTRERQIVALIQQAKSNKEIAYELQLSVGTIKEYLCRLYKKVGVSSRTELALRATPRA